MQKEIRISDQYECLSAIRLLRLWEREGVLARKECLSMKIRKNEHAS
jgi:hypothetical protein